MATKKGRAKTVKRTLKKQAHPSQWFVLHNGKQIRSLKELAQEMGDMEDYVYFHHVTDDRNDFCSWIKDVFDEFDLAEQLAGIKDKRAAQVKIYEHLLNKLW